MKRALPIVIIVGVFGTSVLSFWYLRRPVAGPAGPGTPVAPANRTGPVKLGAEPPHALGDMNAPVMLEEFGDFECSPCGLLHPVLKTIKAEFGSGVVIVFREFALVTKHKHALEAAQAAEAAGLQGKFWEMHDVLYESQKTWRESTDVRPIFEEYAGKAGLNLDRFKQDRSSETVNRRISLDRQRGDWIGVIGTPTVFLNGREVPLKSLSADKLRALINAELKSPGK
jgi:protein-disulfide isomerase